MRLRSRKNDTIAGMSRSSASLFLLAFLGCSCGDDSAPPPPPPTDTGPPRDTGPDTGGMDGGGPMDAGDGSIMPPDDTGIRDSGPGPLGCIFDPSRGDIIRLGSDTGEAG